MFGAHYLAAEADATGGSLPRFTDLPVHVADTGGDVLVTTYVEDGLFRVETDLDATALLRQEPAAERMLPDVDAFVLEYVRRAVRVHELLVLAGRIIRPHPGWFDSYVAYLGRHDPTREYWTPIHL